MREVKDPQMMDANSETTFLSFDDFWKDYQGTLRLNNFRYYFLMNGMFTQAFQESPEFIALRNVKGGSGSRISAITLQRMALNP